MTPLEHFAWAQQLPHLEQELKQPLSSCQLELLRQLTSQPQQVMENARIQLQYWTARKQKLAAVNASYRQTLDPRDQGTIGQLDFFLLEEMLVAAGHVDTAYVKDLSQGFPVTGRLSDGDCGRPIPGGQRVHGTPGLDGQSPLRISRANVTGLTWLP